MPTPPGKFTPDSTVGWRAMTAGLRLLHCDARLSH
jgi:hypothetical protein